jgi:hypothetical protein
MKITLKWHPEKEEESSISIDAKWLKLDGLSKLDHLKDSIWYLEQEYQKAYKQYSDEMQVIRDKMVDLKRLK